MSELDIDLAILEQNMEAERQDVEVTMLEQLQDENASLKAERAALLSDARAMVEALEKLLAAVKEVPSMNHHSYDALGIEVNKALALPLALAVKAGKLK